MVADLVVRAPEAGVPVLLLEIDRRSEDAHDLVVKLRRYWEWGRLLPKDAVKHTVDLVRSRPDAIETVDHEQRLWRRFYPPTGREGLVPVAFEHGRRAGGGRPPLLGAAPVRLPLREGGHREGLLPGGARRRYHSWSSSRSTAPVWRCGGGWDARRSRR
ncbi:hypothetical protein [Streptomyces sp. NPDC008121]|uniref:hypothetical protein n=1 Tax=Streptomyces sp. NPDC008121 TaxID=3364809 RepID=UPI0036ECAF70